MDMDGTVTNGNDMTEFGERCFFFNTTDALLRDRGYLGWQGLRVGGMAVVHSSSGAHQCGGWW